MQGRADALKKADAGLNIPSATCTELPCMYLGNDWTGRIGWYPGSKKRAYAYKKAADGMNELGQEHKWRQHCSALKGIHMAVLLFMQCKAACAEACSTPQETSGQGTQEGCLVPWQREASRRLQEGSWGSRGAWAGAGGWYQLFSSLHIHTLALQVRPVTTGGMPSEKSTPLLAASENLPIFGLHNRSCFNHASASARLVWHQRGQCPAKAWPGKPNMKTVSMLPAYQHLSYAPRQVKV